MVQEVEQGGEPDGTGWNEGDHFAKGWKERMEKVLGQGATRYNKVD